MRTSIVRHFFALPIVLGGGLFVLSAQAAPPVSCQSESPIHTLHLGAGVDTVAVTSTKSYWDNECKCLVVQLDVPSTSAPQHTDKLEKRFKILASSGDLPNDTCGTSKLQLFIYKKDGSEWKLLSERTSPAQLNPGALGSNQLFCAAFAISDVHFPPASGTDTYRVLAKVAVGNGFHAVTVSAVRDPKPAPGPGPH